MGELKLDGNIFWKTPETFIEHIIKDVKGKSVILFCTNSSIERLSLEDFYGNLGKSTKLTHIHSIPSNPTYKDVHNIIAGYDKRVPDIAIAIGGGSAMDITKAVMGLMYLKDRPGFSQDMVLDSLREKEYLDHEISTPIYAVPTTAGTGSEVTQWATVWDMDSKAKYSIDAKWLLPERAYIVPEFTVTMPKGLTLSTGLDALCQAMEAYWAKSSNPMVRVLSLLAIKLIVEYLPKTLEEPQDLYFRQKVCLGSLFSGISFSQTRTTACHSMSYPLTMEYGIEHGLACALTLAKVMEVNLPKIHEADILLESLKVANPNELQTWIDELSKDIVKMRLSNFDIREEDIDKIAHLSFTQGRMDNNPVDLDIGDVKTLLRSIM